MAAMSSHTSIEYEIFINSYDYLHEGIQPELDQLLPKVYAKKLIGTSTKEEAQLPTRTSPQRASTLLSAIDSKIRTSPVAFDIFMRVLRGIPSLRYLAEKLQEKILERQSQRGQISIASDGSSMRQAQPVYGSMPTPSSALPQSALVLGSVQPERRSPCILLNQTSLGIDSRVSEEQLSQECEDIPLAEIASQMSDWQTIHMHLSITDLELEDICHEHRNPLRQRQVFLQKWKRKYAHLATYKELTKCFLNANRPDLVRLVCNAISPQADNEESDSTTTVSRAVAHETDLPSNGFLDSTIPFPKQQSQRQGSLSPTTDMPLPQIIRTQPSTDAADEQENEFYQHNPNSEISKKEKTRCKRASIVSLSDSETNYSLLPSPMSPSLSMRTSSSDSVVNSFKSACSHFTISKESVSENSEGDSADEGLKRELDQIAEKCKQKFDKNAKQVRILKKKLDELKIKYNKKEEALKAVKQQLSEKEEALIAAKQQLSEKEEALIAAKQHLSEQELLTQMQHPYQEAEPSTIEIDALRKELEITNSYLQEVDAERKDLESKLSRAEREQKQFHTLKEKNWELQCKVVKLNMQIREQDQTIVQRDKTIAELKLEIQDLKFATEFINSYERRRSSSI